jgi:hypothetical protein
MDAVDQVDHVAQQVTALHPVGEALKDGCGHVAPLAPPIIAAQAVGALTSFADVESYERRRRAETRYPEFVARSLTRFRPRNLAKRLHRGRSAIYSESSWTGGTTK